MNRCSRAIASIVAESRPPDNNTTAADPSTLPSRHIAPQVFVQLNLQAHRQPVLEYPVGERARRELLMTRRKQHRAAGREGELARSEEHTSELQSQSNLVCRLLLEK